MARSRCFRSLPSPNIISRSPSSKPSIIHFKPIPQHTLAAPPSSGLTAYFAVLSWRLRNISTQHPGVLLGCTHLERQRNSR
jgi:hypothetical protein